MPMNTFMKQPNKPPLFTGEVARLLGTTEPPLSELVRRGKITPAPDVTAGRRQWQVFHIIQAAIALGLGDQIDDILSNAGIKEEEASDGK